MKLKYRMSIIWSNEDDCYLVSLPDFPGQQWRTHGATYLQAFEHGLEVMEELHLAVVNDDIPAPRIITAESIECQIA